MKTRVDVDTPDEALTPRSRKRPCATPRQDDRDLVATRLERAPGESDPALEQPLRRPMHLMDAPRHGPSCSRANNEDLTLLIQAVERARSLLRHRCDRRMAGAGTH